MAQDRDEPPTSDETPEDVEVVDRPKKKGKGGKEKEEGYKFKVPTFDEDAFIHKELTSFRTTTILFLWGILAAALSWLVFGALDGAQTGWYIGLLIMAAMGAGLKWLYPLLQADIRHFKRREWFGTGVLYFFTWLAVFIFLVNPPVSDYAEPQITVYASPPFQQEGAPIELDIFETDNDRIDDRMFSLTRGNTSIADHDDLIRISPGHYRYDASALSAGTYDYEVSAADATGHTATVQGSFRISSRAITVDLPADNIMDERTDLLLVSFLDDADFAYVALQVQENDETVYLERDDEFGGWLATANYAGWNQGTNTFTVHGAIQNTFHGTTLVEGGQLTAGPYTMEVTANTGDHVPDYEELNTDPPVRQVPGPGMLVLVAGLALAAVATRAKRS